MATRAARDRWPSSLYIGFYRDAEGFTAACRPAIDAVATVLADNAASWTYAEVAELATAAMEGNPAPVVPSWAQAEVLQAPTDDSLLRTSLESVPASTPFASTPTPAPPTANEP